MRHYDGGDSARSCGCGCGCGFVDRGGYCGFMIVEAGGPDVNIYGFNEVTQVLISDRRARLKFEWCFMPSLVEMWPDEP
jgi:hypothetical protein